MRWRNDVLTNADGCLIRKPSAMPRDPSTPRRAACAHSCAPLRMTRVFYGTTGCSLNGSEAWPWAGLFRAFGPAAPWSSLQALGSPRLRSRAGLRETLRHSAFSFDLSPWWDDRAAFDSIRIRNPVAGRHRSITAEKNPPHVARPRENGFGRSLGFRDEAVPVFEACDK